jgi:hypothetical protein
VRRKTTMPLSHDLGPSLQRVASIVRAATAEEAAQLILEDDPWMAEDYGGRQAPTSEVISHMSTQEHLLALLAEGPPEMLVQGHDPR